MLKRVKAFFKYLVCQHFTPAVGAGFILLWIFCAPLSFVILSSLYFANENEDISFDPFLLLGSAGIGFMLGIATAIVGAHFRMKWLSEEHSQAHDSVKFDV